jgi:hypothetical protein
MRKIDGVRARLQPPVLEGRAGAEVTLIGWGSTWSVIHEAAEQLNRAGITTNQLHFKYMHPFHGTEASAILKTCKRTIVVENTFSGQFARHLRAESGFTVDHVLTRYDGEPFEPAYIAERVKTLLAGKAVDLEVQEHEAMEMAYHHIRIHMQDRARPRRMRKVPGAAYGEDVWAVELVNRTDARPEGMLVIGASTGAGYGWHQAAPSVLGETSSAIFESSVGLPTGADPQSAPARRAH